MSIIKDVTKNVTIEVTTEVTMANSNDCIFCAIIDGKLPSTKLYETDKVLAFLDIAPFNEGHTLIIPKYHAENILELPEDFGNEILKAQKIVASALMKTLNAKGFNCFQNNFAAAGQVVFHVHYHVLPRYDVSEFPLWKPAKYESQDAMNDLAKKIIEHI